MLSTDFPPGGPHPPAARHGPVDRSVAQGVDHVDGVVGGRAEGEAEQWSRIPPGHLDEGVLPACHLAADLGIGELARISWHRKWRRLAGLGDEKNLPREDDVGAAMPFRAAMSRHGTPKRCPIEDSVSPVPTVYIRGRWGEGWLGTCW
jgi:hypothetical protein